MRFVLAMALVGLPLPLSASAQDAEESTIVEPSTQEPAPSSEQAPEEPALQLELDDAGVEVTPSPPRTADGYTMEEMELRVKRAKIGLGVSAAVTVAGVVPLVLGYSGTTSHLERVSFTDANNGTAVGELGTILRTTDGGATWTAQSSGTSNTLFDVSFTDANNGTVVGSSGTILRTTDGGANWEQQNSGTPYFLYGVSFTDALTGTAVGAWGTILRMRDGGATWVPQDSGTTNGLYGVSFTDANNGTAVGYDGIILRTTGGGVTDGREQVAKRSTLMETASRWLPTSVASHDRKPAARCATWTRLSVSPTISNAVQRTAHSPHSECIQSRIGARTGRSRAPS